MAGGSSVKLFQFMQKYCQTVGLHLPQSNQNRYNLIIVQLIFVICSAQFFSASAASCMYIDGFNEIYSRLFHNNLEIGRYFKVYRKL